jgi:hypothetical protein
MEIAKSNKIDHTKFHKELKRGEVYMFNTTVDRFNKTYSSLKTARLGDIAYSLDGEDLSAEHPELKPCFVHKKEFYAFDALYQKQ